MAPKVQIHLPRQVYEAVAANPDQFYRKLETGLTAQGIPAQIVRRAPYNMAPPQDDIFHFVHQGWHRQDNVLNTGLGYIYPFWYADPWGIYGQSSIAAAVFEAPSGPEVDVFYRRTRTRLVGKRFSRYDQKAELTDLPGGVIAVFLQGNSDILDRARHMSTPDMIEAVVAAANGRTVVFKPHPKGQTKKELALLDRLCRLPNVTQADANIHDILANAAVTVSISSAVALEGFLHGVPAVLCGASDLHHCAVTATDPAAIGDAIETAEAKDWPFARFLYWFLKGQLLNAGADDLIDRVLLKMAGQGR